MAVALRMGRYTGIVIVYLLVILGSDYYRSCVSAGPWSQSPAKTFKARIVLVREDQSIEFGGKSDIDNNDSEPDPDSSSDSGLNPPSSSTYPSSNKGGGGGVEARKKYSRLSFNLADLILRNSPTNRKKLMVEKVLTDRPNSDVVFSENILKSTDIRLECSSSDPIFWSYTGHGHPPDSVTVETRRTFRNFYDPDTYEYFATVHLAKIGEKNTGNYTCKSLTNPDQILYYYIFVPGINFFVTTTVQTLVVKQGEKSIVLPCSTSSPNVSTFLFKTGPLGHPERVVNPKFDPKIGFTLPLSDLYSLPTANNNNESPFGEYVCTSGNESMTSSIIVNVEPPKELIVRPTVKGNYVYLDSNIRQMFICEGKHNLTFTFSQNFSSPPKISYQFDPEKENSFPYTSTFEADPREFSNHSLINCVRVDSENSPSSSTDFLPSSAVLARKLKPLHTWEYSTMGNDRRLRFSYDAKVDGFLCCSEDSFIAPEMTPFFPCSSPIECDLRNYRNPQIERAKEDFLTKSTRDTKFRFNKDNDDYRSLVEEGEGERLEMGNIFTDTLNSGSDARLNKYTSHRNSEGGNSHIRNIYSDATLQIPSNSLPRGCRGYRKAKTNYEGYFRCSIQDGDGDLMTQDYFYAVIDGKPVLSFDELTPRDDEAIVHLHYENVRRKNGVDRGGEALEVNAGQEAEIYCSPNKFFFAQGHVLAFERSNGSLEFVPQELMRDQTVIISSKTGETETFYPKRIRTVKFPDPSIIKLHCFAPIFLSSEWRSSSVQVKVHNTNYD